MYEATVIEVFIASPGDVDKERECVRQAITDWNIKNSEYRKAVLKSLGWEQDVPPSLEQGKKPQDIINKILERADVLVGIFRERIGTPTEKYESGTVEEIIMHMEKKRPTMIFFYDGPVGHMPNNEEQSQKLFKFREWCKTTGIIGEYKSTTDFSTGFEKDLAKHIDKLLEKRDENPSVKKVPQNSAPVPKNTDAIRISPKAHEMLNEIVQDEKKQLIVRMDHRGYAIKTNGINFGSKLSKLEKVSEINDVIEELEQHGFIIAADFKKEIYTITEDGLSP